MRTSFSLFCALLSVFVLSACGNGVQPPLPSGEQVIIGVLKPAELSAVRRGSYFINQDGVNVYYAESSLVNLRMYENKQVTLRGVLAHNTDPNDLPVLVVESIVDVEETVESHTLSDLHVTVETPRSWKLLKREGQFQFRIDTEEDPIVVIYEEKGGVLPEGGVPIVVDATRATRLIDELSGAHIVSIKQSESILVLRFTPGERINADRLREEFLTLLKSVHLEPIKDENIPSIGTGSLSTPCGGTAGILCPDGYFCEIQDVEQNIGKCRKI